MNSEEKIKQADLQSLRIIHYPDVRLAEASSLISQFNEELSRLAERMFELMFAAHGVGLAAPQVAVTVRLFVASPTAEPEDRRVYVNSRIISAEGWQEDEEGCLSVPGVTCKVKRRQAVVLEAQDLTGQRFQETGEGLLARVFQHESDHLDGQLILDRMGSVARLANRRQIRDMEDQFGQV